MTYAVVMAALELDTPPIGVLAAATKVSAMFDARLIGVAAGECSMSPYYAEGAVAERFIAAAEAELKGELKMLEQTFRKASSGRSDQTIWRSAEKLPGKHILAAARGADLIVVARPSEGANFMRAPDVGDLLMHAGRPVLVVPPVADHFAFNRVVVAWKDTREARRAVSDALPMLKAAREVHLLCVHEPEREEAAAMAGADEVANWLSQHGVKALAVSGPDYGTVGKTIEQFADEQECDLIVAGAYGHSRFTEWLLGGVTRHLLRASKHSVLFSH